MFKCLKNIICWFHDEKVVSPLKNIVYYWYHYLIIQVSEFKFLGITIDENITRNPNIRNISIKIAMAIGILRKLKRYFCDIYITSYL